MNITSHGDSTDPFTQDYASWLARESDWSEVYAISSSFRHVGDDPFVWTPLLSTQDRYQAFRENDGKCLNCGGSDHSMKFCRSPFLNTSGVMNPELGLRNDNSEAFRRWQNRMKSHRRDPVESGSSNHKRNKRYNNSSHRRSSSGNSRSHGYNQNRGNFQQSAGQQNNQSTALALHPQQQSNTTSTASGVMVSTNNNARQPGNFQNGGQNGSNSRN